MDVKELMAQIDSLNSQAETINANRVKNIGKKETLEAQCTNLLEQYERKFGVKLTIETLDTEFERVMAEKGQEAKLLGDVISAIQAGKYEQANAIMGVKPDEQPVYDTTDFTKRKQEITHTNYEVQTGSPVVTTEMARQASAVVSAQETLASVATDTGADFTKSNDDVVTPIEVATPKPIAAPVEDDIDDMPVPKITMPAGVKPVALKPSFKVPTDDFDAPEPPTNSGMTKEEAPMDALTGFTPPQQAAPTGMFDTASPKPSGARSFAEMFGSAFK